MSRPVGLTRRRMLAGLTAVGLASLAGCTVPFARAAPPADVTVRVRNDDDRTHHVTLAFLDGDASGPAPFDGVRIFYADGSESYADADTLDGIPVELLADASSFRPLSGVLFGEYPAVRPESDVSEGLGRVVSPWLLYIVSVPGEDEPLRTFGQLTCLPTGLESVEIHVQDREHVAVSIGCHDAAATA